MSFDFSTLITDRSAEDLAKKATKAFYNASDLNRVTACMDYLDGELRRLGYESGYQRVRIERPSAPNGLPDGYTRLAYIESTGTQYILTDVVPNQDTEMEVVFSTRQSNQCGIAVCDFSWQQRGYGVWGNAAALGNMTAQNINLYDGEKHIVTVKNKRLSIDGQEKIAYSGENFACPCPLSVFALNRNGAIQEKTTMKLFSLSIDGEQYIPCRDPAGTVGLYNDTRQKFLKNAGTGAFLAGPRKVTLPEGYTQLEYIESSGTQYIDTGISPTGETRVLFEADFPVQETAAWLFGARDANKANTYGFLVYKNQYRSDYKATGAEIASSNGPKLSGDKNKGKTYLNGALVASLPEEAFSAKNKLVICANITDGSVAGFCKAKHYLYEIFEGASCKRDFIPCKAPSGAIGLYDYVSKQFYGNSGTGAFTPGPEIAPDVPSEPAPEPLDPYLWYDTDAPTAPQMAQYLANVAALRAVFTLPEGTPQTPQSMALLTFAKANDIERVLQVVESALERMALTFVACGTATVGGDYL